MTVVSLSSASDFARLIGLPWQAGAQGPDVYDCWAFAAMIQERHFNRPLARVAGFGTPEAAREVVAARQSWQRAGKPRHGDMVECSRHGRPDHVGVFLDIDRGGVLHCQQGAGVCFDRVRDLELLGWRASYWAPGRRLGAPSGPAIAGLYVASIAPLLDDRLLDAEPEEIAAAHRGIPLDVRVGDTPAIVLARAGIDPARVMVFVRPRGDAARLEQFRDPGDVVEALNALGRIDAAAWPTRLIGSDEVMLVQHLPLGGGEGGSNPLRSILMIAVLVAAAFAAGPLGGILAPALGIGLKSATGLAFGAINFVGTLAINALLPPPSPEGQRGGLIGESSPTYSANPGGALARPGAVIPVQLGRHIHRVDDAAPPWSSYVNNVQRIRQLLCLGVGGHLVDEVRLGSTVVWADGVLTENLPDIAIEIIDPNQSVTLFEDAVLTQSDVAGQLLEPSNPIGWHAVTPPGIDTEAVEIDIGFQQLLDFSGGSDSARTVEILVEAQAIDIDGNGVGSQFTLETLSFTDTTRSPIRSTHRYSLPAGRYQMRLTRQTADGGEDVLDDAFWLGLKAVLSSGRSYGDVQLLALQIDVGSEIAGQTAREVSVVKTRKVPVWENGAWTAPQATRSIAWGIAEIARMHDRLDDLSIEELISLDETWTANGDTLDVVIDQEMSFWTALQSACRAGRAQPDQIGRQIRIWRDEPRSIPRQLFSERNIVRGSLRESPILPTRARPDRLIVPYLDEVTWKIVQIEVGSEGRARQERYFGITNRAQLTREISHDWRTSRLRPGTVSFDVELEGRMLFRGDPIAVAHRQLTRTQSVAIATWQGRFVELAQDIVVSDIGADPVIALSMPDGRVWGPARFDAASDTGRTRNLVIDADEFDALVASLGDPSAWCAPAVDRQEQLRAAIGPSSQIWHRLIVQSIGAEREGICTISGIEDDPRAHDADVSVGIDGGPVIQAISAEIRVDGITTYVDVTISLAAAPVADTIIYQYSTDGGVSWVLSVETAATTVSLETPGTVTDIRAAPIGVLRGAWSRVTVGVGSITAPTVPVEVSPGQYAATAVLHVTTGAVAGADHYEWLVASSDPSEPAVLRSTVSPELLLSVSEQQTFGGPWRDILVEVRAVTAAGVRSVTSDVTLANAAPSAPSNLRIVDLAYGEIAVSWDQAPDDVDVTTWSISTSPGYTITQSAQTVNMPASSGWTFTVSAIDAVGSGPASEISYAPEVDPGN